MPALLNTISASGADLRKCGDGVRGADVELVCDHLRAVVGECGSGRRVDLEGSARQHFVDERRTEPAPATGDHDHFACYCNHRSFLPFI